MTAFFTAFLLLFGISFSADSLTITAPNKNMDRVEVAPGERASAQQKTDDVYMKDVVIGDLTGV